VSPCGSQTPWNSLLFLFLSFARCSWSLIPCREAPTVSRRRLLPPACSRSVLKP
jgi:hypothetical protein